jgi:hypothetical protein
MVPWKSGEPMAQIKDVVASDGEKMVEQIDPTFAT